MLLEPKIFKDIYAKCPINETLTDFVDQDEMQQNAVSDQGLHSTVYHKRHSIPKPLSTITQLVERY